MVALTSCISTLCMSTHMRTGLFENGFLLRVRIYAHAHVHMRMYTHAVSRKMLSFVDVLYKKIEMLRGKWYKLEAGHDMGSELKNLDVQMRTDDQKHGLRDKVDVRWLMHAFILCVVCMCVYVCIHVCIYV
jgi:hypothetical protein